VVCASATEGLARASGAAARPTAAWPHGQSEHV